MNEPEDSDYTSIIPVISIKILVDLFSARIPINPTRLDFSQSILIIVDKFHRPFAPSLL